VTVFAPYAGSYASVTPYITAAEYLASPTGVNVSQLVPRGTQDQNSDALDQVILRASSYVDQICNQVLGATVDVESGRYRVRRDGSVAVPTTFSPIIAVNDISAGFSPSSMTSLPSLSDVWIDRKVIMFNLGSIQLGSAFSALTGDGKVYASIQYVNGYANALLTVAASAGMTSLTLDNVLGMTVGTQLFIADPGSSETVFVTAVNGNVITLASPLMFAHQVGVNVSSLPNAVKQATILLTSALIKTRGTEAIVMGQLRAQPAQTAVAEDGGLQEVAIARDLLNKFVRTI
jgi:hypothetical protein